MSLRTGEVAIDGDAENGSGGGMANVDGGWLVVEDEDVVVVVVVGWLAARWGRRRCRGRGGLLVAVGRSEEGDGLMV